MGQRLLLPFPLWGKGQGERGQWILPTVTGMACRCPCTMYKVTGIGGLLDGLNRYLNSIYSALTIHPFLKRRRRLISISPGNAGG